MRQVRGWCSLVVIIVLGSSMINACTGPISDPPSEEAPADPSKPAGPRLVVTRPGPELPEGCSVREVAETVTSFGFETSSGGAAAIASSIAPENDFRSVGVTPPRGLMGRSTTEREAILEYLGERSEKGETYTPSLIKVANEVEDSTIEGEVVRVDFVAVRDADDLPRPLKYRGWGEIRCETGQIYLLNLGLFDERERTGSWCPPPSTQQASGSYTIACASERGYGAASDAT